METEIPTTISKPEIKVKAYRAFIALPNKEIGERVLEEKIVINKDELLHLCSAAFKAGYDKDTISSNMNRGVEFVFGKFWESIKFIDGF